jgi:hypothetical protein
MPPPRDSKSAIRYGTIAEAKLHRQTVEHPFGTIKARMGATHFLMKTLPWFGIVANGLLADFFNTIGTKRTFKVLRRRSDVLIEGRADMAVTRVTPLTFYRERMVQVAHQGAGAPQVHGGLGRVFARNYVRRSSLEYSGLRGEGSTPVPLPPPVSL